MDVAKDCLGLLAFLDVVLCKRNGCCEGLSWLISFFVDSAVCFCKKAPYVIFGACLGRLWKNCFTVVMKMLKFYEDTQITYNI